MSLKIDLELFGQLLPGMPRRQALTMEEPLLVREVVNSLRLNPDEIGLITINGIQSELDDSILSDCRLCFFPPMSGG